MNIWTLIPIALLLILPAFLLGGVHILTFSGMGILASVLLYYLAYRIQQRSAETRGFRIDGWFWLFLVAILVTTLQLVPLPLSWIEFLAPSTAEVLRQSLGAVGLYPDGPFRPISLAPPETAAKLLRDMASLLVYIVVLQWAHNRERIRRLMHIAVISAAGLCGLIVLQSLLRIPNPLLGLYTPNTPTQGWLFGSPFINHKHLSGYLLFHALLVLPLISDATTLRDRIGWSVALGTLSITLLVTNNTYAFVIFLAGSLIYLWMLGHRTFTESTTDPTKIDAIYDPLPILAVDPATALPLPEKTPEQAIEDAKRKKRVDRKYQRSSRDPKPVWKGWKIVWENLVYRISFGLGILAVGGLLWVGAQSLSTTKSTPSHHSWSFAKPMLQHYSLLGVGRGATPMAWHRFASDKTPYQGQQTITHIESQWLQPFVDWGIPFGLFFVVCCVFLFWQTIRRSDSFLERSILLAMSALLLQNAADFNLEFLGTAFPFLIFLAALQRLQLNHQKPKLRPPYALGVIATIGILMVLSLTPYARAHNYHQLPQQWKALKRLPPTSMEEQIKQFIQHHPSDFVLAAALTEYYTFQKKWQPKKALMWSNKGLFLNPTSTQIHLLRGIILARLKLYKQATQHLSQAVKLQPTLITKATRTVFQYRFASVAILHSHEPLFVVRLLREWKECKNKPAACATLAEQATTKHPKSIALQEEMALLQWKQVNLCHQKAKNASGSQQQKWNNKSKRWRTKLKATLTQLSKANSQHKSFALLIQGHLARLDKKNEQAQRHFEEILKRRSGQQWRAFLALYHLLKETKQYKQTYALLHQSRRRFTSHKKLAQLAFFEGNVLQQEGKHKLALIRYGEATQHNSLDIYWLATAKTCWTLKQYQCTVRIYQRLIQKPGNQHLKTQLKRLKKNANITDSTKFE